MAVMAMARSPCRKHLAEDATDRQHHQSHLVVAGPGAEDAAAVAHDYTRGNIIVMLHVAILAPPVTPMQPILILQFLLMLRMPVPVKIVITTILVLTLLVLMLDTIGLILTAMPMILMMLLVTVLLIVAILVSILLILATWVMELRWSYRMVYTVVPHGTYRAV